MSGNALKTAQWLFAIFIGLACLGVQPPGHPFWTPETLRRAQVRYPGWDLSPYRAAMA